MPTMLSWNLKIFGDPCWRIYKIIFYVALLQICHETVTIGAPNLRGEMGGKNEKTEFYNSNSLCWPIFDNRSGQRSQFDTLLLS